EECMQDAQDSMNRQRGKRAWGLMAGLALFGSVGFLAGHFTGAPVGAVAAPVSQVTPSGTEMAPGFPEIAKAVRPAVVNITPAKTLVRQPREHKGREGRSPMDQMEEFF